MQTSCRFEQAKRMSSYLFEPFTAKISCGAGFMSRVRVLAISGSMALVEHLEDGEHRTSPGRRWIKGQIDEIRLDWPIIKEEVV